jgi:hypothetical protein
MQHDGTPPPGAGIHKEYMRDLCEDSLDKQSHNMHKLVRCPGIALSALSATCPPPPPPPTHTHTSPLPSGP